MAQKQQSESEDVTAAALNRTITPEDYEGKKPLIPAGEYSPVTVNIKQIKKFVDDDTGVASEKMYIKYTCPNTDIDLSAAHKISFHLKAPFGRLVRACFPNMTEAQLKAAPPKLADMNGKRVKMVVDYDEVNGTKFNDFRFFSIPSAAKA